MSSLTSVKKRPGLLEVVNRLSLGASESKSEQLDCDEDIESVTEEVPEKRRASASSFHLAKNFAPPTSPQSSDSSDEAQEKETEVRKGPTEPMRCGVCGLRVYKSYRYISRSSAPNHLKNFFDPDTDRFRVCKRCHSSKERCRQNLSLLLLKSETEQYIHLRSPLGTTHHRRSHSMKFLTRDIGRSLKRPYEDLTCDETLDEDYLSDADETTLLKAAKKEPISANNVPSNGVEKSNGTGVVTVVRPSSNNFVVYPNHFTTYGEITKTTEESGKANVKTELTTIKIFNKKPEEKSAEVEAENNPDNANGELRSEIRTINYKLTLLDHAYALPPAKNMKLIKTATAKPIVPNKVPKIIKADSLAKTAIRNMIKNNSQVKKKEASIGTSTENKDPPTRTCGIICSLCSNLVTKSYSCYRKENAPEKIRPLFTGDVKVMKVCRRCVPYKKPKGTEEVPAKSSKIKMKMSMNKFLKQKVKNAKKAVKIESKYTESDSSLQTNETTKISEKSMEENGDNMIKAEQEKPLERPLVQVSPKQDTKMLHVSIKNGKVESARTTGDTITNAFPPIGTAKDSETPVKTNPTISVLQDKIAVQSQPSVVFLKLKGLDSVTKQTNVNNSTTQVDFGTQPMHSMIGNKKPKPKSKDECMQIEEPDMKSLDKKEETDTKKREEDTKDNNTAEAIQDVLTDEKQDKKDKQDDKKDVKIEIKSKQAKENEIEKALGKAATESAPKPIDIKTIKSMNMTMEPVRSSPRRDKSIVPPDKKKENTSDTKPTTLSTRKRQGKSESESENVKQKDDKNNAKQNDDESTNKKNGDEKTSEKAEATLKRSTRKGRGMKRKDSECSSSSIDTDRRDSKKAKADDTKESSRSYSTRYGQSPTKCCCCSESSQKLFRCVQNGRSPSHIKPLFEREGTNTLRICRKCLNCRSRVKSFL